jgi:hypothetical protein
MGTQIEEGFYVILIDIDNKNNSMEIWQNLVIKNSKSKTIKTPTATTGNNGLHYLFKVSEEQMNKMQNSYTKLSIDGEKIDVDVKGRMEYN